MSNIVAVKTLTYFILMKKTKLCFFSSLHGADDKLVVDKETTKSQITPQASHSYKFPSVL